MTAVRLLPLLLPLAFVACGGDAPPQEEMMAVAPDTALLSADAVRIGGFTLAAAESAPWREAWRVPARVTHDPSAVQPLGSIVEGRVLEVRHAPGDRVREGEIIVVVHSHEVMDARQQAVAAVAAAISADSAAAVAVSAAERAERLLAAKAVSVADVERARAARASAVASREAAHAERDRALAFVEHLVGDGTPPGTDEHAALHRAPFDGVLTARQAQPGQVVLVGQPLVTVARDVGLGLLLQLPEVASSQVRVGEDVRFTVPAFPGRYFAARITRVSPVVDSMSRAIEAWARASGESQRLLRAEMTADAELLGAAEGSVLSVPNESVQLYEGDTVVVRAARLGEGMLLEAVPVRVGRRSSLRTEILAGLGVGDSVLVQGAAVGKAEIAKRKAGGEGGDGH
ncbi:MAG: efflux RND transporter periplasmic adaptor subunit [Gemmatimonadaceae bacterium]|nr:efflux RND transporter periplasmic adaptor subunit [Gemmatimonadaceae bacterium]